MTSLCIAMKMVIWCFFLLQHPVRVAVVKGNAYGHGAVPVARHFMATGAADRLAVATVDEAIHLRRAGIDAVIHVLGNYFKKCIMGLIFKRDYGIVF